MLKTTFEVLLENTIDISIGLGIMITSIMNMKSNQKTREVIVKDTQDRKNMI